jgi:hypothetical protein
MQLYLDCDGVLADFDRGATELLGMPPRAYQKHRGIGATLLQRGNSNRRNPFPSILITRCGRSPDICGS